MNKYYFHLILEGLINENDVKEINVFFEPLIKTFSKNSLIFLTEVKPQTQLINFSFITAIKPLIPIFKPFMKRRVVFGLTGINHVVFSKYAKLVGLSGEHLILKDKRECEEQLNINFERDFY